MTISHPKHMTPADKEPFVFAELGGFTCSICSPNTMTRREVEEFATSIFNGRWQSINKEELGFGSPTPNPCNGAPGLRTHWFMMRDT